MGLALPGVDGAGVEAGGLGGEVVEVELAHLPLHSKAQLVRGVGRPG